MIRPFDLTIRDHKLSLLLDIEPGRYYSDFALGHYLDHNQAPEPELLHVLFRALKPGDLAVDAGACVGFFSIVMSKLVGPTGKVIAVEPDDRNVTMLRKNLDINDCDNIEIVHQPLGARDGDHVAFVESEENGQSHIASLVGESGSMRVTTTLAAILGAQVPVLLKLDIEGSETDALQGFPQYRHRIPYIVSEINPAALACADTSPEELREWLYYRGYFPHVLHDSGALPSRVEAKQHLKITRENTNMLFCGTKNLVALWPEVEP